MQLDIINKIDKIDEIDEIDEIDKIDEIDEIDEIDKIDEIEYYVNGIITANIPYVYSSKFEEHNLYNLKVRKQPNSINRKCYILDNNLKNIVKDIIKYYTKDIITLFDPLFSKFESIISFITINSSDNNINIINNVNGVKLHRDQSDYTFNINLNDNYSGGELKLIGKSDKITKQYEIIHKKIQDYYLFESKPSKNKIIIHRGNHAHQLEKVLNGTRLNLIIWCYEKKLDPLILYDLEDFIIY